MTKGNILIVEDDPKVVIFMADQLEYSEYGVRIARNGKEALQLLADKRPDLIVLDVMMPEMDGYEVCQHLKSRVDTKHIPILMLTAKGQQQDKVKGLDLGADDYLAKPYDKDEFLARIEALLRRTRSLPFASNHERCDVIISIEPQHRSRIRITGKITLNAVSEQLLSVDSDAYNRLASNTYSNDWRFNSKNSGKQLYERLFQAHQEILGNYHRALGEVEKYKDLHLRFESTRNLLGLPIEFLYDDFVGSGDYLVLKHPLSRIIRGVGNKKQPISKDFLNEIWEKEDNLRILLIASNTGGISSVDREVETLHTSLPGLFEGSHIRIQIKVLSTENATYDLVKQELKNCKYHLLHYAGHGSHDPTSPEKSQIYVWKDHSRKEIKPISASELMMLVRDSHLRFAYFSCCSSTKTSDKDKLLDDDFLGVSDALIQADVPAVLGFRWPVSDTGAELFALSFYQSLAQNGDLDLALLDARCEVASQDRDDITWLSPILILQK